MPDEYAVMLQLVNKLQDIGLKVVRVDQFNHMITVSYRLEKRDEVLHRSG